MLPSIGPITTKSAVEGECWEVRGYDLRRCALVQVAYHRRRPSVRPGFPLQGSDFSFILVNREDERRRCLNGKVLGDAQYAERRARSGGGRRGRQRLSLLRLLPTQDDDHPGTLLTASANRAHDSARYDSAHNDSTQNYP